MIDHGGRETCGDEMIAEIPHSQFILKAKKADWGPLLNHVVVTF